MHLHSSYSCFPLESNADVNRNVQTPNPTIERERLSVARAIYGTYRQMAQANSQEPEYRLQPK